MKFLNISKSALILALVTSIISEQALSMNSANQANVQPAAQQIAQVNAVAVAPVQGVPANTTSNLTDWAIALGASSVLMACAIANDTTGLPETNSSIIMSCILTGLIAAGVKKWTPLPRIARAGMYLPIGIVNSILGKK